MADFPIIRDVLTIDDTVQQFYDTFDGAGPLFLLGRVVQHARGYTLQLNGRPLVIIADFYNGNGGGIDGSGGVFNGKGVPKAHVPPVAGGNGVDGVNATLRKIGSSWRPVSAGKSGTPGGDGSSGSAGTSVTLMCHNGTGININVSASASAAGGDGGSGGSGGDGEPDRTYDSGEMVEGYPGTHGGKGGSGGKGGNGANGGTVVVWSMQPLPNPLLVAGSTPGSSGGRGGRWGRNGSNIPVNEDGSEDPQVDFAPNGTNGINGASPAPDVQVLDQANYLDRMRALLDSDPDRNFGNYWAPFRITVGEYYFRQFQPDDDMTDKGTLTAREFNAALELQNDNVEAKRLRNLLLSGSNALGLPRYLDVVPDFGRYINTYNAVTTLVTGFFNAGIVQILAAQQLDAIKSLLVAQRMIAQDAVATATSDLSYAQVDQKIAADEVTYIQQQLDETTTQIQQAMAAMQSQGMTIEGVLGTVAEIGAAVVSVVAAIPTGGASLVALVPALLTLTSTVVEEAPRIAKQVFAGDKPDLDDVQKAYKQVGEDVQAVIAAGKTVVNFVKVVEKISSGSTPENAQSVALVKRGAELTHQLLVARNQVGLNDQKTQAVQAHLERTQGILEYIRNAATITSDSIRDAGLQTISAALLQVDTLLTFAFLAQRSFEIYTVPSPPRLTPLLNAGITHPDVVRAYQDGVPHAEGPMVQSYQSAWNTLLQPVGLQKAYADYLQRGVQADIVRLSFTAEVDGPLLAQLRATGVMPFQVAVNSISQNRKETKIRGVAVSLVGATSPSGVISCAIWHGTRYEQIGPDGSLDVQTLEAKSYTLPAPVTPLVLDPVHFGQDDPIDAPQALPFWGRGTGGDWNLRLPETQPHGEPVDLSGLRVVQIWIGYQFVPNS
jgi:hypothetical protein